MVEYKDALLQLGVKDSADLEGISEDQLLKAGIPLAAARLLVSGINRPSALGSASGAPSAAVGAMKVLEASPAKSAMIYLNDMGLVRGDRPTAQIFFSSVLGGCFISWGAAMYLSLGGGTAEFLAAAPGLHKIVAALIFPIGLSAIVISGTDMLTSNMMYSTLPFASRDPRKTDEEKAASLGHLWAVSGVGNFVGCLGMAWACSHLLAGTPAVAFAQALAVKKTSMPMAVVFAKAAGANWLVNLAIFQATTASTTPGKMVALWLPITTFVTLGLEHFVANMYFIPLGMMLDANVSLYDFAISNMLPTFAGNALGAGFFVSYLHWKAIMGNTIPGDQPPASK